jgi:predicted dehydrogenase
MRNFLEAVRGDAPPINSSLQAVQLMEILDAVYQSSRTGREVVFGVDDR